LKAIFSIVRLVDPLYLATRLQRFAPLPVRILTGYGFMAHGYAKIIKHPDHFAAILHALGVPAPHFMAWATIVIELFGGLMILAGFAVPLVAVPMFAVLLVATLTVHLPYGFTSIKLMDVVNGMPVFGPPGYETDLLYAAALLTLLLGGSGPLAVDTLLRPWYERLGAKHERVDAGRASARWVE
jgi:putative oxidoreductase